MTDTQTTDIIDVEGEEITESTSLPAQRPPGASAALFGTTDPVEVLTAARRAAEALVEVLEERKLYKEIRNKKHVFIEGWLMLAGMLQISTPNVWVKPIEENGKRIGWEARYEARAADGRLLSSAEGECRRTEDTWADRDEHAIRSMAQTRAQSKALASALRWVVELGGFAGTPAEEMPTNGDKSPYIDGAQCPSCGSKVYDNRDTATPENKRPVFRCANKECTGGSQGRSWATWDRSYFLPPEIRAKQRVYDTVSSHEKGWRIYFDADAPGYTGDERMLLEIIHESGEHGEMAGFLWNRLITAYYRHTGQEESSEPEIDYAVIVRAAELALAQAEEDAADLILEDRAIEIAEEQLHDERADAEVGMSDYR